jgi:hypothetical protein
MDDPTLIGSGAGEHGSLLGSKRGYWIYKTSLMAFRRPYLSGPDLRHRCRAVRIGRLIFGQYQPPSYTGGDLPCRHVPSGSATGRAAAGLRRGGTARSISCSTSRGRLRMTSSTTRSVEARQSEGTTAHGKQPERCIFEDIRYASGAWSAALLCLPCWFIMTSR